MSFIEIEVENNDNKSFEWQTCNINILVKCAH